MTAYTAITVSELAKLGALLDQVTARPEPAVDIVKNERDFLVRMVAVVRARGTVLSPKAEAAIALLSLE